jgi:hypothetical protein
VPSTYVRKPPVTCFNCGDSMIKRRSSQTGRYYCPKAECQATRHRDWQADRSDPRLRETQDALDALKTGATSFISALMHRSAATCQECGFTNAPLGFPHFNREGGRCAGLGAYDGPISPEMALAAWPESARVYVDVKRS